MIYLSFALVILGSFGIGYLHGCAKTMLKYDIGIFTYFIYRKSEIIEALSKANEPLDLEEQSANCSLLIRDLNITTIFNMFIAKGLDPAKYGIKLNEIEKLMNKNRKGKDALPD